MPYEVSTSDGFTISDDQNRLDLAEAYRFITEESYWGKNRRWDLFEKAVRNSIAFGVYAATGEQVGFARVLSDLALRAHLSDLYVLARFRGSGLGKALVAAVLNHPELAAVPTWTLSTKDAHGLYASFGFDVIAEPQRHMMRQMDTKTASSDAFFTAP